MFLYEANREGPSIFAFHVIVLLLLCILDILCGSVSFPLQSLLSSQESPARAILALRTNGMIQCCMVGGVLALSGSILQRLLKNPLADPYVLGISSGGSFFAALCILVPASFVRLYAPIEKFLPLQSCASLLGCLISGGLIYYLKIVVTSFHQSTFYLIIGIILNTFFAALLMLIIALADQTQLAQIQQWLLGSLQRISFSQISVLFVICIFCVIFIFRKSNKLKYLVFEDEFTLSLGIDPSKIRNQFIFAICFLIAVTVSMCGAVGFAGLIVPHYVHRLKKTTIKEEFYLNIIIGASVLVLADLLSRVMLAPSQLPVGIFTALIGAPALTYIFLKKQRKGLT